MDPVLKAMCVDVVQHAPFVGQDEYGKPTYGPAVARPARIEWRVEAFTNQLGQERVSQAIAYTDWDYVLDLRDQMTLSDGSAPPLQRIDRWTDETGQHDHYRLYF